MTSTYFYKDTLLINTWDALAGSLEEIYCDFVVRSFTRILNVILRLMQCVYHTTEESKYD